MAESISENEVADWFDKIRLSLKWREKHEKRWIKNIERLEGAVIEESDDVDRICINLTHPHVRIVVPAVYSRNPDIMVTPTKREEYFDELCQKRAEVMRNLLRYYLRELDLKEEFKDCILDAILTSHSWIKVGYETEFEIEQTEKESPTLIRRAINALIGEEEEEEEKKYYNEKIVSERPWALRASPFDMIVPAFSVRPDELDWISQRIILPYGKVLNNPNYDTDGLKPSCNANDLLKLIRGFSDNDVGAFGKNLDYCVLYETYDKDSMKVITLCDGHKKSLEVKDSVWGFLDSGYHPYHMLRFNKVSDRFYGQSDLDPALPQFDELDDLRTKYNKHINRFSRMYLSRPGALDHTGKTQIKEAEDGAVIEVTDNYEEKPLEDHVQALESPPVPPDIYRGIAEVKNDILNILGTDAYAVSTGADSATEAAINASKSRVRVDERIDVVANFAQKVLRSLAQISQKFLTEGMVGNVVGPDGIFWVSIKSNKEIRGEYTYSVVYGSTTPITKESEFIKYKELYSIAANDPYYDQIKIRLEYLRKLDVVNPEEFLDKKIAEMMQLQLIQAARMGALGAGRAENRSGSSSAGSTPQNPGAGGSASVRDRQAAGGILTPKPNRVPGGPGGTADRTGY